MEGEEEEEEEGEGEKEGEKERKGKDGNSSHATDATYLPCLGISKSEFTKDARCERRVQVMRVSANVTMNLRER